MRSSRLSSNVIETSADNVVKSACIYGANNSEKTCLVRIIRALWGVILSKPSDFSTNLFSDDSVFSLSCVFIENGNEWEYSFALEYDQYKNIKEDVYFERNFIKLSFFSKDEALNPSLQLMGRMNILIHAVDASTFSFLKEAKHVLVGSTSRIVIVDMNNIPLSQTMAMLKNHDTLQKDIVSFVKNADLGFDDFRY